jgi:hypothetical protein
MIKIFFFEYFYKPINNLSEGLWRPSLILSQSNNRCPSSSQDMVILLYIKLTYVFKKPVKVNEKDNLVMIVERKPANRQRFRIL